MKVTVETINAVKKKLLFEVPVDRVALEYNKVFDEIRKKASIKGFRKGKVPRTLIEKHYSDLLEQDVVKNLVNETYFKALAEQKIVPVSFPEIENDALRQGESFRYSAVVEVFPEVFVKDYEGLELNKQSYCYNEEAIMNRLREMQESLSQLKPVEAGQAAEAGHFITFDFEGFIDGAPFENGKGADYQLELGSGRFIPGFEEQLIGMLTGDEGEIQVTFPADYGHTELAGKDAVFRVKIKEVKGKELPPLDDEFAGQFGEFRTLAQLKEHLKNAHEKQEMDRIHSELREEAVRALISNNDIQIPGTLIDQQVEQMLENAKKRLAYQRMTLEMMGLDDEKYKTQFRPVAESQVKGSLLLDSLAKQEHITACEDDLEEKLRQMSSDNEQSNEAMRNYYLKNQKAKENLMIQIVEDKAIDLLLARAKISAIPCDPAKK